MTRKFPPPTVLGSEQPLSSSGVFTKFCASCQRHGLLVPVERVRVLPPTAILDNKASNGPWSAPRELQLPPYRVCNQTMRCPGPRFAILKAEYRSLYSKYRSRRHVFGCFHCIRSRSVRAVLRIHCEIASSHPDVGVLL